MPLLKGRCGRFQPVIIDINRAQKNFNGTSVLDQLAGLQLEKKHPQQH